MIKQFDLTIEAKPGDVIGIVEWVEKKLADCRISQNDSQEIQLAVEEACTNIAMHGYKGKNGPITICCQVSDDYVLIRLEDEAYPFDPTTVTKPDITGEPDEISIGGLGVHLMKQLMDSVDYEFKNGKNVLKMNKNICRP